MSRRSRKRARPIRGEVVKALPPSVYAGNLTNAPQTYGLADAINALTSRSPGAAFKPLPRSPLDATPFGPLNPLTPAPLDPARRDTERPEPRVTEYPVAWNIPGNEQRLVPWTVLREAARTVDVMRRCIEIRKRHVRSLKWAWTVSADTIQEAFRNDPRRGHEDIQVELREKFYPEIQRLTEFWQKPWRSNGLGFGQWINGVLEHHLVYDGIPIYPRTTYGGDLLDLELVDPTTIKPLLDWRGARPLPPYPAFQQILYGFPRGEFEATVEVDEKTGNRLVDRGYLADQLYYHVENFRYGSWPYGFSAVEQALISARLYLRRQGWMLAEYDDGSTPLTWLIPEGTAETLDPRQRREWEVALNDELAGQTAARHRVKVSFPGFKPEMMPSVDERYKPEYDLYLLKLLASHFGVTIAELGFTEAKGLGSSGYHEGQEDVQDRVGRRPDTEMLAGIVQDLSRSFLNAPPELEFQFLGLESEDEAAADDVAKNRMARGSMTVNEDRRRIGLPLFDFPEADMPMVETGRGVVFLDGASTLAAPGAMIGPAEAPPTTTDPDAKPGDDTTSDGQPAEQNDTETDQAQDGGGEGDNAKPDPAEGDDTKPAVGKHATPNPAVADTVYRQLLEDYPPDAIGWVRAAHWQGPSSVALDRIDYGNADTWQAAHEQRKVDLFADKIQAGKMKPIILVREPHNPKLIVIDGHHRALAYRKLGQRAVAYIARVGTTTGPWDEMHDQQLHGGSDSTANSEPVSAPPAMSSSSDADKAAERVAYRRWCRRNPHPTRPFVFKHLDAAEQVALTKAADDGGDGEDPKADQPPDTRWPGWQMDLTLAAYWAQKIRQTLTGEVGTRHVADAWHRAYPGWRDGDPIPDPRAWLATQDVHLSGPLGQVIADLYTEGYLVGDRSAQAVLAAGLGATVDWGDWKPGDPQAARLILSGDGSDVGLERLLQSAGVTISSIADGRLDEVAAVLADGLENGLGPDEIAAALRGVLDDPAWARMVALTETNRAMSAATLQRYRDNGVPAKEWLSAEDTRVCSPCSENEGDGPIPLGAYFSSGADFPPGHPSCFPAGVVVTGPSVTAATARRYEGDLLTVVFASGEELPVTPNHPVLTPDGWVPAGDLDEGSEVLRARDPERVLDLVCPDDRQAVSRIEDVAGSLVETGAVTTVLMPTAAEDFHGDGTGDDYVEVVLVQRDTQFARVAKLGEHGAQRGLLVAEGPTSPGRRDLDARGMVLGLAPAGLVRGGEHGGALSGAGALPADEHCRGPVATVNAGLGQHAVDRRPLKSVSSREGLDRLAAKEVFDEVRRGGFAMQSGPACLAAGGDSASNEPLTKGLMTDATHGRALADRLAGLVERDRVVEIRRVFWAGHVYNLETIEGWYFANGIVAHNCRCAVTPAQLTESAATSAGVTAAADASDGGDEEID